MKISDTVVGAGFAGAGALVVAATLNYPTLDGGHPGPALFPQILGTLMVVFGGLLSLRGLRARDTTEKVAWLALHRNAGFVNALFVLGGVLAYILLVERIGFLIMGALVLFVLMWRLEVSLLKALLVAVIFTAAVHVLFSKILFVPLPRGMLAW